MNLVKEISFGNTDILIIDPCYFTDSDEDREYSDYGEDLTRLNISGISALTVWGDIAGWVVTALGEYLGTVSIDLEVIIHRRDYILYKSNNK